MFWRLTLDLAGLSTCRRAKVGAVVISPDLSGVLAFGYNGPARGRPNDSCRGGEGGTCGCVHGEGNAVAKLGGTGDGLVLLSTTSPCEHCAGLIVNCGRVRYVVYGEAYRDPAGLDVLAGAGVVIVRWGDVEMGDPPG